MKQALVLSRNCPFFHPAGITFIVLLLVVSTVILQAGGDPLALARLGTRYSQGIPDGTEGYDGQFVYYLARDLNPGDVLPYLDVPAYRYQRILLPILARSISFGNTLLLPWVLGVLGILAHTAGTWVVAELMVHWDVSRWYALVYGLWAGFVLAVRLDLPEPLAYALIAGAFGSYIKRRYWLSWILCALALFTKEVAILFVLAFLIVSLLRKEWINLLGLTLIGLLPYALFQVWLWRVFGQPGIASGGTMATPFEIIPFMGLFRIGAYSPFYLLAMLVVFGPAVILPSVWGVWAAARKWFSGDVGLVIFALMSNALIMFFLPFSTYRETGGLLRFASGLVLAVLLYAARYKLRKALNLSLLWLVLNAFLIKS